MEQSVHSTRLLRVVITRLWMRGPDFLWHWVTVVTLVGRRAVNKLQATAVQHDFFKIPRI